ncbi:hypothetical protein EWT43_02130 [Escherichia coli O25b:H4]|uniref:hypothetical protein n=1 Tax=Escherichia coli TaxID=562 RepID=UPI0010FDF683|nr:hypothetical protein [Escherichia coli]TLH18855.1 hypothetical protein EWT43_02130 [Escherichia coli O25b:H4]
MKEIKSKTSSAKKTLVPWFETMGKQVGLSQETISAVLKEQRLRIRKLNYASADAPRDKCTLSCAINGIHAAFHYLKKNYISGCVMTVPTG